MNMDDRYVYVEWNGKRLRLDVDILRALYYAVTNRRVFLAITRSDIPEKEDPADIAKRKKMSRIEFCQEKIRKCRAELAGLKGEAAKAMRQTMYYYRSELNKAKYQYTYRKTDKYRKWKREYERQYRRKKKERDKE